MRKKVSRSGAHQHCDAILAHRSNTISSLGLYFSFQNPNPPANIMNCNQQELDEEFSRAAAETDRQAALTLLASVEAAFRLDYLDRCEKKKKDKLSRALRKVYRTHGTSIRFDEDILNIWKQEEQQSAQIISQLKSAMRYRHWLAHGRYWTPKLGQAFEFIDVALVANLSFDLLASN